MVVSRITAHCGAFGRSLRHTTSALEQHVHCQIPTIHATRSPFHVPVRHATHGAAGRANGPKAGPGKRLGAKKTGDEYVIPGNIIFRQRGTNWHPGSNCGRGRDHTIYAKEEGYVKYYRDPKLHPKRRYIGVVFNRTDTLPVDTNAPRRRRLNMIAVPRISESEVVASSGTVGIIANPSDPTGSSVSVAQTPATLSRRQKREAWAKMRSGRQPTEELTMGPDYSYRESNWAIGRTAERAGIKVELFKPGDRFKAWQKTAVRRQRRAQKMQVGRKKGSSRKGKK